MRILLGTFEIARQLYDLADGFRRLGHTVETAVSVRNPQHPELEYDMEFAPGKLVQHLQHLLKHPLGAYLQPTAELELLRRWLTEFDVYVFQFGHSLLPGNKDLPLLKQMGKRIISIFNGSDIRHWSAVEPVAAHYGYTELPPHYREQPYADLNARLHSLRMAERYSDVIISNPFQSGLAVRPYRHFYLPVNLDLFEHRIPAREVPVIVHAPSRHRAKGTADFADALERLHDEGIPFEIRLLQGRSNQEVRDALIDADLVLDQPNSPHYAMFALEGMATGCAVASGHELGYVPCQEGSPVYDIRTGRIYDDLKRLLTDKNLRLRLAEQGRPYVERYHSHIAVGASILSMLDEDDADYYPTYFSRDYALPEGESINEPILQLTSEVVQRWGLPVEAAASNMAQRALLDVDALDPHVPIFYWKPYSEKIKSEIWGWSNTGHQPPHAESLNSASKVLSTLMHTLNRGTGPHSDVIGSRIEECLAHGRRHPESINDPDVLIALGRMANEMGERAMASQLWRQSLQLDPTREDVRTALMLLDQVSSDAA